MLDTKRCFQPRSLIAISSGRSSFNMLGAFRRGNYRLVGTELLNPLYWILHSVAACPALWQLVVRPHYWDKTLHFVEHPHE